MNKKIKDLIEVLIVAVLFLVFSWFVQSNLEFFENLITNDFIGILIYILIEISSIVVAPVTTFPLIAVASNLWGWVLAGILNVFSWTLGSWIAFVIGRKYGVRIIRKFLPISKIHKIEKKIPQEHLFWSVVLLRMMIPADVLSYALGIFTRMSVKNYLLATVIGITPFAFLLAYLGGIPIQYQVLLFLIAGILIILGWIVKLTCRECVNIMGGN